MAIFLIRHGETIWNAARIIQLPETPLSERGRLQAACVARRVAGETAAAVLSSDYTRAWQTADAIAQASGAPLEARESLRERSFGAHRGVRFEDLPEGVFEPDYAPPGGEDRATFEARVARAWEQITTFAAGLAGNTAVVTHALVYRVIIERHLDTRQLAGEGHVRLPNTAFTAFDPRPPYRVHVLASASHLEGDARPDERVHPAGI